MTSADVFLVPTFLALPSQFDQYKYKKGARKSPGASPCPTYSPHKTVSLLQNLLQTSYFKLHPRQKCDVLLVPCPHCHLIIACPFTCHPDVSNTSACKKLTITCLLSSLHLCFSLPSPYKSNLKSKDIFVPKSGPASLSRNSLSHLSNCQFVYHLPHLFHICQFICCFQLRVFIVQSMALKCSCPVMAFPVLILHSVHFLLCGWLRLRTRFLTVFSPPSGTARPPSPRSFKPSLTP